VLVHKPGGDARVARLTAGAHLFVDDGSSRTGTERNDLRSGFA
jgi:hypothetical protein